MKNKDIHINTELLVEFLQGCLMEESHETKQYSESKNTVHLPMTVLQ